MTTQSMQQPINNLSGQGRKPNIIGFSASPRSNGNTAWVVNKILEGAKAQGAAVAAWQSSQLAIQPCNSCYGCRQGELCGQGALRCIVNDDMQQLYDALTAADAIVFASPVYMGQMSAQAKIFNDRLFGRYKPHFHPNFQAEYAAQKKMLLVFTQGNPDTRLFQPYFEYTQEMFRLLGFAMQGIHVVAGMRNGPAEARTELYPVWQELGAALAAQ